MKNQFAVANARLEASESNTSRLDLEKQNLQRQVDFLREEVEDECKKRQFLETQNKQSGIALADLRARLEEEATSKADLQKKLSDVLANRKVDEPPDTGATGVENPPDFQSGR